MKNVLKLTGFILPIVLVLTFLWVKCGKNGSQIDKGTQKTESLTQKKQPTKVTVKYLTEIGTEGKLFLEGAKHVIVAIDKDALDELIDAQVAKDTEGIEQLVRSPRAMLVLNNTHVKIIDKGFAITKIRTQESLQEGKTVWVPYERVVYAKVIDEKKKAAMESLPIIEVRK